MKVIDNVSPRRPKIGDVIKAPDWPADAWYTVGFINEKYISFKGYPAITYVTDKIGWIWREDEANKE